MRERDAVAKLDAICGVYFVGRDKVSVDGKTRLLSSIANYLNVVRENGQENSRGDFGYTNFRKVFGVDIGDTPEIRYNKISTFRV